MPTSCIKQFYLEPPKVSRSQQNHHNHNCSVLFCCKRNNCIFCVIMMATCKEIVLFFPNIFFLKKMMVEQSPTSRQLVVNYSELVVDQSPISHRLIADLSLTNCRLIGVWSATIPVAENNCNSRRGRKQKSVTVRSRRDASSVGPRL